MKTLCSERFQDARECLVGRPRFVLGQSGKPRLEELQGWPEVARHGGTHCGCVSVPACAFVCVSGCEAVGVCLWLWGVCLPLCVGLTQNPCEGGQAAVG